MWYCARLFGKRQRTKEREKINVVDPGNMALSNLHDHIYFDLP